MCISKILTDSCFIKQKTKTKNIFARVAYSVLVVEHKEDCFSINGTESVRFENRAIEFKNYFKQVPVPFKVNADFECNLKSVEGYEWSYSKKISKPHSL